MPYPSDDTHPSPTTYPGLVDVPLPGVGQGLKIALTGLDGAIKTDLTNRAPGSNVHFLLNDHRTAQVTISLASGAAPKITPFDTALAIWLDGFPIFRGPLILPRFAAGNTQRVGDIDPADEAGTITIAATQPSVHLEDGQMSILPVPGFNNMDQGDIMWELIKRSQTDLQLPVGPDLPHYRGHGIKKGTWANSINRERHYSEGINVWEEIQKLANVENGADFDFRPLADSEIGPITLDPELDGSNLVEFDVFYPRMGSDRSGSVRFEFNYGRHNTAAFAWEPGGGEMCNVSRWIGKPNGTAVFEGFDYDLGPQAYAWNIESMRQYGVYMETVSDPDIKSKTTLKEHARGTVRHRAFPKDFVEITPAVERGGAVFAWARNDSGVLQPLPMEGLAAPPKFGPDTGPGGVHDYFLGDVVRFLGRKAPAIDLALNARVVEATLTEVDDAGTLVTEIVVGTDSEPAPTADYADDFAVSLNGRHHGRKHHRRHHHRHHRPHDRHHRAKLSDLL